ncbi:R3H domain protein [Wolffia australiana]
MSRKADDLPPGFSVDDAPIAWDNAKSRGRLIEKKIDFLETITGKVSNRRSRRWLNDRLLFELVPRLNAEEIRGLFAPPPWGDEVPVSAFSKTNVSEWDSFRNIDMDKQARMIQGMETFTRKRDIPSSAAVDKSIALIAWRRVDRRTREALRRNFLPDLVQSYEKCIQEFISNSGEEEAMVLSVQDPFRRLVLHGVCEFYDLVSVTQTKNKEGKDWKVTMIRRKRSGSQKIPVGVTMAGFMRAAKVREPS